MSDTASPTVAEAGGGTPEVQTKKETKMAGASSSAKTLAETWICDRINEYLKAANADHIVQHEASLAAATTVNGALYHFNKTETAVDAYENILNKGAATLAKKMALAAAETQGYVARVAEIKASLAAANATFSEAKNMLVAADEAGARLSDLVRREWKDDPSVLLLEDKVDKFRDTVECYEREIENASDQMNNALLLLKKVSVTLTPESLTTETQEAKAMTDAYHAALLANLNDSKQKLGLAQAGLANAQAIKAQAEYAHGGSLNNIHVVESLKALITL